MRFIGGKRLMLDRINEVIEENTHNDVVVIGDLFSGSGVVAQYFKQQGNQVISNDIMYMSYVLVRGMTELNCKPTFSLLSGINVFEYLNELSKPISMANAFIYNNYSPNENCNRMYFQTNNALKIDAIRQQIEKWFLSKKLLEEEYYYLIACLISSVPFVANITGVYAAYLKHWDKRTFKELTIEPIEVTDSRFECKAFNMDATELCKKQRFDLAYIDTPYNQREYTPNYHLLETIARYDAPEIRGVTGMRNYAKSAFCSKSSVKEAFIDLFANLDAKYAVVSYNTDALFDTQEMMSLFSAFGSVKLYEYPYRRYKSKIPNNIDGLKEQLYFIDLRENGK